MSCDFNRNELERKTVRVAKCEKPYNFLQEETSYTFKLLEERCQFGPEFMEITQQMLRTLSDHSVIIASE